MCEHERENCVFLVHFERYIFFKRVSDLIAVLSTSDNNVVNTHKQPLESLGPCQHNALSNVTHQVVSGWFVPRLEGFNY